MIESRHLPSIHMFHAWRTYDPSRDYGDMTMVYFKNDKPTLYCTKTDSFGFVYNLKEIDSVDRPVPILVLECDSVPNPYPSSQGNDGRQGHTDEASEIINGA